MSNLSIKVGNLLDSHAQTLVNTVNCVGIMGKGIALEFKKKYPAMFFDYRTRCEAGFVKLGQPYLYKKNTDKWILNFPTKGHWREVSRLDDIVKGLEYLKDNYKSWGITSIAVPPLGCGNGQLDWEVVGGTLTKYLKDLDIPVELYAPHGTPHEQLQLSFFENRSEIEGHKKFKMPPSAVALVGIISRIQSETYKWPIGRVSFMKIAYFATQVGIDTGLEFKRDSYGPYSAEFKALSARLINNGLITEERQGKMHVISRGQTYPDARESNKEYLRSIVDKVERVADLFLRLPTTTDAEIAATVHFVANEALVDGKTRTTEKSVLEAVLEWKKNRDGISKEEVAEMIRQLNILGWVNLEPSEDLDILVDGF